MHWIAFLLLGCFFSATAYSDHHDPYIAFSQLPLATDVQLSPDGKSLAYLVNQQGYTILMTLDIDAGKSYGIIKTDNEKFTFRWIRWANNDHIVFSALYPDRRYSIGTKEARLFIAEKNSNSVDELIAARLSPLRLQNNQEHQAQIQDNVINWLPDDPEHILVSVDFEQPLEDSVYKVNLYKKNRKRMLRPKRDVRDWETDQQGRVRIGNAYDEDTGIYSTHILDIEEDEWHVMWEREALIDPPFIPLGFGLDPNILYLRTDYNGRGAVYTVDTRHLDQPPKLKVSDPKYDIQGSLIYSAKSSEAIGVFHTQAEGSRIYWDPYYQQLEASINNTFPGTENHLVSFSRDERRYVLFTTNDTSPGTYYLGDRDKKTLSPIFSTYPQLGDISLAPKQQVVLKMRDGLTIEAYLTLPINHQPGQKLPAVLFPHGGPVSRDYGGFDYWTQYFAAKGIAVLQPNFRGSAGYGHEFMLQAIGNYGLGMQNDLVDATHWLIDEGISDPDRICIVGASYGGYAALTASFKSPELYQCAISFAGISDLKAVRNRSRNFMNQAVVEKQLGDDYELLEDNSAYYNVDKIKIPVLLVHGEMDRNVPPKQSEKLASRLQDQGKVFEYLELENGTHYLMNQKNRTTLFKAIDDFVDKYLRLTN